MSARDGGPAFPIPIAGCADGGVYNALEQSSGELGGMSVRQFYKAQALAAVVAIAHAENWAQFGDKWRYGVAQECADYADAMLAEDAEVAAKAAG